MNSHHANTRMQQRGIPALAIDLVETYGKEIHDHRHAVIIHLDKEGRKRMEKECGRLAVAALEPFLDIYLVRALDGQLITIGHNYKRKYAVH